MTSKKKIGVLLCGCGHRDGSEVHEATFALLAIDRAGAERVCFAVRGPQRFVRDHTNGENVDEVRDALVESARISRGNISDVSEIHSSDIDALIIPGGQGAALNISTYLVSGASCEVSPEVARLLKEMVRDKKPIGGICIAPSVLAKVFQDIGISATITAGTDTKVAADYEAMGQRSVNCQPTDCVIDRENKIVTTPAYMNAKRITEVWAGVEKLVNTVIEMI